MNTTLLATLVGVLTGVISSFITHYFQVRLERQRMLLQAKSNSRKDFKLEIAGTVQTIMAMIHEMAWTTWEASKGQAKNKDVYLSQYNEKAKKNLTLLSQKLALIAATDISIYEKIREIAQTVFSLDEELANELVKLSEGKSSNENFAKMKKEVNNIEGHLPKQFAEILKLADKMDL